MKTGLKQIGNYTIAEELGEGSFGKVYKGIDRSDKTEVALKFISKKGKNRKDLEGLHLENQMLKKVSHHNIIRLIDLIETKNQMIIVTDYAGENLSELLKKHKRFTYDEVKNYSRQIYSALVYLNENKITHRDLKPANILIKDGIIKICDFGFARKLSASTNFMNSLKGTPLYIAPQILDGRAYTHKVDIWSFGIIIYELFQGITPFHAQTLHQLKPKILGQKVQFPKDMPVDMKILITGMLQKNPINRFDWPDLKKEGFFDEQILSQINENINKKEAKKDGTSATKQERSCEKVKDDEPENLGLNSNVVHFLKGEKDIEEIRKIQKQLWQGKLNGKQLKTDGDLFDKIMAILSSYCIGQNIVPKEIIQKIYSILTYLITKVKNTTPEQIEKDFTRKKDLFLCILKITEQETDPEYLDKQFVLIGFLLKLNFNSVSVDYDTDQDVTDLCLKQIQNPKSQKCFSNALKVMGILGSQGIVTLTHSQDFFVRIEEEKILGVIAQAYEPAPKKTIVLECLQIFIHPNMPAYIENNTQLKKIFNSLKQQVAIVLFNKKFISVNPLTVFSDKALQTYAKITYQCLKHSDLFRKQFLKHDYWLEMVKVKNLTSFWLAYDFICESREQVSLLPNEVLRRECNEGGACYMDKVFLLARAGLQLTKKTSSAKVQHFQTILMAIAENLSESEDVKVKAARSVEGFLCFGQRIFEQTLAQTLCNILNEKEVKVQINEGLLLSIIENLFNLKVSGKMRVSPQTTAKVIIVLQEMVSKSDKASLKTNKKFISLIFNLFNFYLNNGIFFQLSQEETPSFTNKFLVSIFTLVRYYSVVDEKELFMAYCKAEDKGLHSLLVSEPLFNKKTLNITLTFLLKVSTDPKHNQSVIDFIGMSLLPKLRPVMHSMVKEREECNLEIMIQIIQVLSLLMKKNQQYAGRVKDSEIISHIKYLLLSENETVCQHTLMFIGHLAKHSQYFFDEFSKYGVFWSIVDSIRKMKGKSETAGGELSQTPGGEPSQKVGGELLQKVGGEPLQKVGGELSQKVGGGPSQKIVKSLIYAIGNISFYTDRFKRQIVQLVPILSDTLRNLNDPHTITNTISTVSNLLRHSNCYLKALIQHKVIGRIMQIVLETDRADNNMMFGLNTLKKALMYPQILEAHPVDQFAKIYHEKKGIAGVGDSNECMKKIRELL